MAIYEKPLFIFEMANNHQGSVEHGKNIIYELEKSCERFRPYFDFAVKFQYRNLDTFIHPEYRERTDIKNIKRFQETRLNKNEFKELKEAVKAANFYTICTPFDEDSVDLIMEHGYDVIKIASCSFLDWPLLEKIAKQNKPVIASAAGSSLEDIHKVVSFLKHRNIPVSLMHCVAEYPTVSEKLQMNQIDLLKKNFPDIRIGFSTHESPDNFLPVSIAVAKGAQIFEKHVGLPTDEITLNGYSASPEQVEQWMEAALEAYQMCGVYDVRYTPDEKELSDLAALQRGIFVSEDIIAGDTLHAGNVYCAFPSAKGQLLAKDISKYNHITLQESKKRNEPVMLSDVAIENKQKIVEQVVAQVIDVLKKSHLQIPNGSKCSISHHYGIEKYNQIGVAIIDCINREYCKKILVLLPGQDHPTHFHKQKEETFSVVYGELNVTLDDQKQTISSGENVVVERNRKHSFSSDTGCVFEEISTTHYVDDSYYEKEKEFINPRKTVVYITRDMLN